MQKVHDELLHHLLRHPCGAETHADFAGGEVGGLHLFQRFHVDFKLFRQNGCRGSCGGQLFAHVAGQVFVRRHEGQAVRRKERFGNVIGVQTAGVPENNALQLVFQLLCGFAGQQAHKVQIHAGFLVERDRQRFAGAVGVGDRLGAADGALGEDVAFAFQPALVVQHLQRTQQEIGGILAECLFIAPAVDETVLFGKGIILAVEVGLLLLNQLVVHIVHLVVQQGAQRIPQPDEALDAALCGGGGCDGNHAAVLPVINRSFHEGVAEVFHIRVGGNTGVQFFVRVLGLPFGVNRPQASQRPVQRLSKVRAGTRLADAFHAVPAAFQHHVTQHHVRVLHKIVVHGDAGGIVQIHPCRVGVDDVVPPLQKKNVGGDLGACAAGEGVLRQTDRAQQLRPLCQIPAHLRAGLVHGAFAGDERHKAARTHFVQRFGEEIVMDQKIVLVIPLVGNFVLSERHVANGGIEKTVGDGGTLKALNGDAGILV